MFWPASAYGLWSSEHSKEKVYVVYTLSGLSWSAVSLGTEAASYKRLVQGSPIFSAFSVSICCQ